MAPNRHATVSAALVALAAALIGAASSSSSKSDSKSSDVDGAGFGPQKVTYDSRSLLLDGKRELFFSGSIHYPRSTPDMWPDLINKAKRGGLNTIDTYVFWNVHEPEPGKYNFEGRYDLVKFLKLAQQQKMYVVLRIGPFIQAEWNHGGFPYWLREIPDITLRSNSPPFKYQMKKFVTKIVDMMKAEKLYRPQGGPIILQQIENEYNQVSAAFKQNGTAYINWAADMAQKAYNGVPWIMCKQMIAPPGVIPTCNGRNCGDTWVGSQDPTKPLFWTENWTAQYRAFGDPPSMRSVEDVAYAVARFVAKNGTLVNYYMYHGGTNLEREGAMFVMTRYYDEGPLDEYGLMKEPKWSHLRDLHFALRLCKKALLSGKYSYEYLGEGIYEARVFETEHQCVAFLSNNSTQEATGYATFRGNKYLLTHRSISILPDCKTVVFNTARVNAQHNDRVYHAPEEAQPAGGWKMFNEPIPKYSKTSVKVVSPLELVNATKDKTDYMWYSTSFKLDNGDLPFRSNIKPVMQIASQGDALHAYVNGKYVVSGHGSKSENVFFVSEKIELKVGVNHICILGLILGMRDNGAWLEHRTAGIKTVQILGLNTGTLDLTMNGWGHEVYLVGEKLGIYNEKGVNKVQWKPVKSNSPLSWYMTYFDAPAGTDPVALNMAAMGKGLVWVNGNGIGRFWSNFLSSLKEPSQAIYHIPRAFLKPKKNLLVILDEWGGQPETIKVTTVRRDVICTSVSEHNPPPIQSWEREGNELKMVSEIAIKGRLACEGNKVMTKIQFATYGNPTGYCGNFTLGPCHSDKALPLAQKMCVGKSSCTLPVDHKAYGTDESCPGTTCTLAVQALCEDK